jgi:hypothetical protein
MMLIIILFASGIPKERLKKISIKHFKDFKKVVTHSREKVQLSIMIPSQILEKRGKGLVRRKSDYFDCF